VVYVITNGYGSNVIGQYDWIAVLRKHSAPSY
jgi:hypothetical protein